MICPLCRTDVDAVVSHTTKRHYRAKEQRLDVTCIVVPRGQVHTVEVVATLVAERRGRER